MAASPGTERPHGHGERANGLEQRSQGADHLRVASAHADQVAGGCRSRPTADATVDYGHSALRRFGTDSSHAFGRDCADHNDSGVGNAGGQYVPGAQQHGADLLVVDYSHHDDVGLASELRRGTGHRGIVGVAEGRFGAHVIHNQRQRSRMDIGGDAATDSAESDYPDHRTILSMLFCEQESPSLIERRSAMGNVTRRRRTASNLRPYSRLVRTRQRVEVDMVVEGVSEHSLWLSQTKSDPPSTFTSAPVM